MSDFTFRTFVAHAINIKKTLVYIQLEEAVLKEEANSNIIIAAMRVRIRFILDTVEIG